jgi:NTE family protein
MRLDFATTGMPFLSNYTSTVLNSPGYYPIQESQTLFLPNYFAHSYGALGSKNVILLSKNIELRLEGYAFQPMRELLPTTDKKTYYGDYLGKRYYIGSAGAVVQSPLGPIGFFLNYFDKKEKPFSFLFHFGYFIFNKSSIN